MSSEMDELEDMVIAVARNIYSDTVIDHAMNPRNVGEISDADGFARIKGPCGDTMQIWIEVNNNIITNITFITDGCGTSAASGSMITVMAKGKNIGQVQKFTRHDVLSALDGLPEENEHCALLAANTIKAAIRDYTVIKREPWRKGYRKY